MRKLRLDRFSAALLLVLSLASATAQAEPLGLAQDRPIDLGQVDPSDHTYDNWYLDTIDGQPAGYWRTALHIEDDQLISTYHEHRIEKHGGELSTYTHSIVWTETKDFKPIRIAVTTAAGSDEVTKTYRFVEDGIELTSEQNGRAIRRKLPPIKGDYFTAAQSSIATDLYLERGEDSFEFNTLDISVGLTPYRTTYTRSKADRKSYKLADGSEANAQQWISTYAILPGFEMANWIDESNEIVGVSYEIDGMAFVSRLADKTVKNHKFDPPEMSGLSVVVPDRPIEKVHQQRKIVYELSYNSGEADVLPIATAMQSVKSLGKGKARVTIDLGAKPQAAEDDRPTKAHLASSIMIDHEDALVRKLAKQAIAELKDDAGAERIAKACKRHITGHINGASLSVGDGSASEAARTREGDCTEMAVLLAALLRANDIPSRCVNGLVYSEDDFAGQANVFVYHMWTQAWIAPGIQGNNKEGYWLDLDAAMWRYSAGHIALGVSAMGDEDQQDLLEIVAMQQNLEIKVIEVIGMD